MKLTWFCFLTFLICANTILAAKKSTKTRSPEGSLIDRGVDIDVMIKDMQNKLKMLQSLKNQIISLQSKVLTKHKLARSHIYYQKIELIKQTHKTLMHETHTSLTSLGFAKQKISCDRKIKSYLNKTLKGLRDLPFYKDLYKSAFSVIKANPDRSKPQILQKILNTFLKIKNINI
jgi:hypothetical protein